MDLPNNITMCCSHKKQGVRPFGYLPIHFATLEAIGQVSHASKDLVVCNIVKKKLPHKTIVFIPHHGQYDTITMSDVCCNRAGSSAGPSPL